MIMWHEDKLFQASNPDSLEELGGIASPAFRLSAQGSLAEAHPLDHVETYDRLFQFFRPLLERFAERLTMVEKAGAKSRRRKTITEDDWQPFHFLKQVIDDKDRHWIGFDFKSGKTAKVFDNGPTGFRLRVARTVQIDVTIPVDEMSNVDMEELQAIILTLPTRTALAGYGLSTSSYFDAHDYAGALLLPAARKYPAIDLCPSPLRSWFSDRDDDFRRSWVSGVNWLTLVGEPFVSALGGIDAICKDLPSDIKIMTSDQAVLFQLGEQPITGEKGEDDEFLPLYHALGRKLQPMGDGCPGREFPRQPVFGSGATEASLLWERRFYDGKWFEES